MMGAIDNMVKGRQARPSEHELDVRPAGEYWDLKQVPLFPDGSGWFKDISRKDREERRYQGHGRNNGYPYP